MTSKDIFTARQSEIVVQKFNGETLVYDLQTNKMYCLNETSALVYDSCNGVDSVSEINRKLNKTLGKSVPEDLIWLAIDQLKQSSLLAGSQASELRFSGVSRREAIRRIGLASMVALPLVTSLVAPRAADAASAGACNSCTNSLPLGSICSLPFGCFSQTGFAGITTTGCATSGTTCRTCTCQIPGGTSSCSSVCA